MGHIIPKLNLNKTPQAVDSNSLVFAKNIKVNQDGSLGRDNAISLIKNLADVGLGDNTYLGHIVGINGCVYFFLRHDDEDFIYEYDEVNLNNNGDPKFNVITCGWHWSGGKITGCVTTNNTNQKILTVSEYFDDNENNVLVPLKHINLSECRQNDDESIYTQNPNIPITNLHFAGYYSCTIPNGVYQFFVRYKVRDGFYTNWFPASKELYAGEPTIEATIQGTLKYVDLTKDCNRSFILNVEHIVTSAIRNYKEFQVGFIVSSNNSVVVRVWKSFSFNTTTIYFDYDNNFIEEFLVDDMIRSSYELYNSSNVINYKNKLYISNYIESDLNPDLEEYAKKVKINIVKKDLADPEITAYINDEELHKEETNDYYNSINGVELSDLYLDNRYFDVIYDDDVAVHKLFDWSSPVHRTQELYDMLANVEHRTIDNYKEYRVYAAYFTDSSNVKHFIYGSQTSLDNIALLKSTSYTKDDYYNRVDDIDATYFEDNDNFDSYGVEDFDFNNFLHNYGGDYLLGIDTTTHKLKYSHGTVGSVDTFVADNLTIIYVKFTGNGSIGEEGSTTDINEEFHGVAWLDIYTRNIEIVPKSIRTTYSDNGNQINTLLPYVHYQFFIHYVKNNGIVTNGYNICTLKPVVYNNENYTTHPLVLYPVITNVDIPDEYIAWFISIRPVTNNVSQLINISSTTADCIDLDALLYSSNDKLELLGDGTERTVGFGEYYGSNSTKIISYFGTAGFVKYESNISPKFIKHFYQNNAEVSDNLIKLTPYISNSDYDDYRNLNSPGFISIVKKLDRDTADDLYVSGMDVFDKTVQGDNIDLQEHSTSIDFIYDDDVIYVYSRYNLNCLTLRENLNKGIRTWNKSTETHTESRTEGGSTINYDVTEDKLEQQWIVSVNSQNCSLIYDLPLMYKEYTRKYYSVVDDKTFTVFDNTVRSSNVDVDEVFRSIYKFDAEDYYNVPTNRGIIVNLFSINNEIFVHTEHGLFKFTDSSLLKVGDNLYSSNKEVGVSESSPFEIGIAEIVDSQYGHGGLQNKEHALITFNGYIFYDSLVRNIYSYDNQSGIQNITPPVRKIIDWFEPTDVTFVSDDANNRFFITLSKVVTETIDDVPTDVKKVICLSYSFISKSFVSIHDIDYTYAFNSRLNTYFIQGSNFLKINYKDFGSYINYKKSVLVVKDEAEMDKNNFGSCIDIIINDGYEAIKALSHIHWICSNINDYVGENPYNVAEELITEYGGDNIRVYSDQTWSDLLPINTEQNTQQINSANSYQYPRYNNGIWTMNYFRDIKNANSNYISDDMALIHGKYIVVRFIFGANKKNFKFENLNINFKNYEKV